MTEEHVQILDSLFSELNSMEVTREGFLNFEGYATRAGVFHYPDGNGGSRRDLRPFDEVMSKASLASYDGKAVTLGHSCRLVDPCNYQRHAIGSIKGAGQPTEDGFVKIRGTIASADAVKAVRDGMYQLSCGYICTKVKKPGKHEQYGPYDAIQKNIYINHVALVEKGRAGPSVGIRLDEENVKVKPIVTQTKGDISMPQNTSVEPSGQEPLQNKVEDAQQTPTYRSSTQEVPMKRSYMADQAIINDREDRLSNEKRALEIENIQIQKELSDSKDENRKLTEEKEAEDNKKEKQILDELSTHFKINVRDTDQRDNSRYKARLASVYLDEEVKPEDTNSLDLCIRSMQRKRVTDLEDQPQEPLGYTTNKEKKEHAKILSRRNIYLRNTYYKNNPDLI